MNLILSGTVNVYATLDSDRPALVLAKGMLYPSELSQVYFCDERELNLEPVVLPAVFTHAYLVLCHQIIIRSLPIADAVRPAVERFGPFGSHRQLAAFLGCARESVTHELRNVEGIERRHGYVGLETK